MNKPAMTVYSNGQYYFFAWALNIPQKNVDKFHECGVYAMSRNLDVINEKKMKSNSSLVLMHTIRSVDLANLIVNDLDTLIKEVINLGDDYNLYVASEGLSYESKGDAALNLATYKGVLLAKIYEHYGDHLCRLFTYSPITLKSTAGCADKEHRSQKLPMIKAFIKEKISHPFRHAIESGALLAKTNYLTCVDDIVDSYWALKTMFKKENLKDV